MHYKTYNSKGFLVWYLQCNSWHCKCTYICELKCYACMYIFHQLLNTSTMYLSLIALDSFISVIYCHILSGSCPNDFIMGKLYKKCFFTMLYDNFMYCMYLWRFSFELTHFFYSHGVLRDDAQWRIISPVMQSGQVYNQYRCTITCNDNG